MSKVYSFGVSSPDIVRLLIDKYDFPEDTILTRLERPLNQDGWIVNLYSEGFPEHGDLNILPTERLREGFKYKKEKK